VKVRDLISLLESNGWRLKKTEEVIDNFVIQIRGWW